MGLNDSFANVTAQILMMKPLPTINKAFSLVVQEERQQGIGVTSLGNTGDSMALYTRFEVPRNNYGRRGYFGKKDRPLCSHCGISGHIVDKCYKLHGFTPSFKFRNTSHVANQVSMLGESSPHLPITQAQCQQLLAMLTSQASLSSASSQTSLSSVQPTLPSQITDITAPASEASSSSTPYQVAAVTSQFMSGTFQPTQAIPNIPSLSNMQLSTSSTQSPAFPSVVIPTPSTDSALPSIFSSPHPHSSPQPHTTPQPCSLAPSHSLCSPPTHISPQHNIVSPVPPIRQSTRAHKLPAYL